MPNSFTITEAHEKLKNREISCAELVRACLDQIDKRNPELNAVVFNNGEQALKKAKEIDAKGTFDNPLTGIPYLAKDVFCENGVPTTACSNILRGPDECVGAPHPSTRSSLRSDRCGAGGGARDWCVGAPHGGALEGKTYRPPYDSTTTKRLNAVGAISLGKTNTDEFTMGASTETSCYGVTRNPCDPSRVAGGSSGGSAAAVASDMCLFALGTDTGGSIRQPAGFCGCTGMRVTYGRTSRYGVIAMASSLDTIGALTKNVEDQTIVLRTIAGHDPFDATTSGEPVPDYRKALGGGVKGVKIGLPKEYFTGGIDPEVAEAVRNAAQTFEALGATVTEISLPHTKYAVATYYVLCPCEISSNMARYDGIRYGSTCSPQAAAPKNLTEYYERVRSEGFGPEVKRRIMLGTFALSAGYYDAYYRKAQKVRTLVKEDFDEAFKSVDVILSPVSPTSAFTIGAHTDDPVAMYLEDVFTVPQALAGIPCIAVPCGTVETPYMASLPNMASLPIGLQIMGKQFDEETVLRAAHAYEQGRT